MSLASIELLQILTFSSHKSLNTIFHNPGGAQIHVYWLSVLLFYFAILKKNREDNNNKHFESSQKLWKDGIGIWKKLYMKYAVKRYLMILVVNQYILLESSFEIMLSELKMSGKWQIFYLLLIYLKHSTEQKSHFIKLWYLKWKGVDRDRTLHLLSLNWTAELILSSDWSVSLKLCSDWLGEL